MVFLKKCYLLSGSPSYLDKGFFFSFLFYKFILYLGLCCCIQTFSSCGEWGLLFFVVHGLLTVVASLVAEHGL